MVVLWRSLRSCVLVCNRGLGVPGLQVWLASFGAPIPRRNQAWGCEGRQRVAASAVPKVLGCRDSPVHSGGLWGSPVFGRTPPTL